MAAEVRAGNSPWHGDRCYVNLLSPGVTEKFLEVTMEAYRREIGQRVRQARPRRLLRRAEHSPGRRSAVERTPGPGVSEALGLQPRSTICPA